MRIARNPDPFAKPNPVPLVRKLGRQTSTPEPRAIMNIRNYLAMVGKLRLEHLQIISFFFSGDYDDEATWLELRPQLLGLLPPELSWPLPLSQYQPRRGTAEALRAFRIKSLPDRIGMDQTLLTLGNRANEQIAAFLSGPAEEDAKEHCLKATYILTLTTALVRLWVSKLADPDTKTDDLILHGGIHTKFAAIEQDLVDICCNLRVPNNHPLSLLHQAALHTALATRALV